MVKSMPVVCADHPELGAEFYCTQDKTYFCYKCSVFNHQTHQVKDAIEYPIENGVKELMDAAITVKQALQGIISQLDKNIDF